MTALSRAIDAADGILSISVGIDFGSLPAPVTIDSENLLVTAGDNARTIHVERGLNGTAAAPHSLGATITQGWGGGPGGVAPTLAEVLAEGNDTGANAIVMPVGVIDGRAVQMYIEADVAADGLAAALTLSTTGAGAAAQLTGGYAEGVGGAASLYVDGPAGRSVYVNGGSAEGSGAGGDFIVQGGSGVGAGRNGLVFLNLPTADPHVAGALWNSSTTVKVSAG